LLDVNALNIGIYAKLNVAAITDLLGETPSGDPALGHFKVPQDSAFPHVCYWVVTGSNEQSFTEWKDEVLVQIDIFSDSNSLKEAGNISKEICTVMDNAEITATGYSVYFCQRQGPPRTLYEDDNKVWHLVLEYRIKLEKSK